MPEPRWVISMGSCANGSVESSCSPFAADIRAAEDTTTTRTLLCVGATGSCRWTCTCPAARQRPRRSSTGCCSCSARFDEAARESAGTASRRSAIELLIAFVLHPSPLESARTHRSSNSRIPARSHVALSLPPILSTSRACAPSGSTVQSSSHAHARPGTPLASTARLASISPRAPVRASTSSCTLAAPDPPLLSQPVHGTRRRAQQPRCVSSQRTWPHGRAQDRAT